MGFPAIATGCPILDSRESNCEASAVHHSMNSEYCEQRTGSGNVRGIVVMSSVETVWAMPRVYRWWCGFGSLRIDHYCCSL